MLFLRLQNEKLIIEIQKDWRIRKHIRKDSE